MGRPNNMEMELRSDSECRAKEEVETERAGEGGGLRSASQRFKKRTDR